MSKSNSMLFHRVTRRVGIVPNIDIIEIVDILVRCLSMIWSVHRRIMFYYVVVVARHSAGGGANVLVGVDVLVGKERRIMLGRESH